MSLVPFHGARVHLLLVVQQPVGGAGDGDGRVQAQGLRRGQEQLALQLELIVLHRAHTHTHTHTQATHSERKEDIVGYNHYTSDHTEDASRL